MPLTNFGSILNFAEEIETRDREFYLTASLHSGASMTAALFEELAAGGRKNLQLVLRVRRENVTEMILEPIDGLNRSAYIHKSGDPLEMPVDEILETALALETRAAAYYRTAGDKIRALPEVARALKQLAERRAANLERLRTA